VIKLVKGECGVDGTMKLNIFLERRKIDVVLFERRKIDIILFEEREGGPPHQIYP
jgi:hypothetical protein